MDARTDLALIQERFPVLYEEPLDVVIDLMTSTEGWTEYGVPCRVERLTAEALRRPVPATHDVVLQGYLSACLSAPPDALPEAIALLKQGILARRSKDVRATACLFRGHAATLSIQEILKRGLDVNATCLTFPPNIRQDWAHVVEEFHSWVLHALSSSYGPSFKKEAGSDIFHKGWPYSACLTYTRVQEAEKALFPLAYQGQTWEERNALSAKIIDEILEEEKGQTERTLQSKKPRPA